MMISEIVNAFNSVYSKDNSTEIEKIHAFFAIPAIPEYLTNEMLMSAFYRALGFTGLKGTSTLKNSRDLHRIIYGSDGFTSGAFSRMEVEKLLSDVLLSPEDSMQKRSQKYPEYLFLAPIVPETSLFSNPARLTRNINANGGLPWNVERFLKALVSYCAKSENDCEDIWNRMFDGLSVAQDNNEDYFAQIVQRVLQNAVDVLRRRIQDGRERLPTWNKQTNDTFDTKQAEIYYKDRHYLSKISPFDCIRNSFLSIFELKPRFSRWQWLTMLDALLRISSVSFIIWLLDTHHVIDQMISDIVFGNGIIDMKAPEEFFIRKYNQYKKTNVFWYGEGSSKTEKQIVIDYGRANIRLAFLLSYVRQTNSIYQTMNWSSISGVVKSLRALKELFSKPKIKEEYFMALEYALDQHSNDMSLKSSRLKHITEFFRVLRQKIVVESQSDFIRYDQSFLIHKKSNYSTAPYIVDFGSVACFAMVYCCAGTRRIFSLKDFENYLSSFYVNVRRTHKEKITEQLKGLGLTLDSPDADDGLMICNPFFEETNK